MTVIPDNIRKYLEKFNLPLEVAFMMKNNLENGIKLSDCTRKIYSDLNINLPFGLFYERLRYINRYFVKDFIKDNRKPFIRPTSNLTEFELENLDKIILNKVIRLHGVRDIYSETHRHPSYIHTLKSKYNLTDPQINFTWNVKNKFYENYDYPISPLTKEILHGTLLGDGHITLSKYNKEKPEIDLSLYRRAINTIKDFLSKPYEMNWEILKKDLIKYREVSKVLSYAPTSTLGIHKDQLEKTWLNIIQSILSTEQIPTKVSPYKKALGKLRYLLYSKKTLQFYNYRLLWYPNEKKSIPKKLELSPTTLLVWLMDDGSFKRNRIVFSTNCFTLTENNFLASLLSETVDAKVKVRKSKDKKYDKTYYYLDITHKSNLNKVINYIRKADQRLLKIVISQYGWKLSSTTKKDFLKKNTCTLSSKE